MAMRMTTIGVCGIAATMSLAVGCGGADGPILIEEINRFEGTTWEEFKAASSVTYEGETHYVVETDIPVEEEELREYYEAQLVGERPKSVVNLSGGAWDVRGDPLNITYCYSNGWNQAQTGYTAPALGPVTSNLEKAMRRWEQVANVRFVHVASLDGAGCNTAGANPGVQFVVTHWNGGGTGGTAIGPFPSKPWANQRLLVPPPGVNYLLGLHELGHALGFRHEHVNSGSGLTAVCGEGGSSADLTAYDTGSCMAYANCVAGNTIANNEVSFWDGVGARKLYGAPARWFPVYSLL